MHLIYVDESHDQKLCVFSALAIPADKWRDAFTEVRKFRRRLRETDGIFVYVEMHAWKFVSGRGRIAPGTVTKGRRCRIFGETLRLMTKLPGARLFNACFPAKEDERAFGRLLKRIDRAMTSWDSQAILICDEGKNVAYTRMARRMQSYSPIAASLETRTGTGATPQNVPIKRIIEDPFFKRSEQSYFIQLTDFTAYALLRRERPVPSKTKYGIDKAFGKLTEILVREASRGDPEGIIRPQ